MSAPTPTGTVQMYIDNSAPFTTQFLNSVGSTAGSDDITGLAPGNHTLFALYSGDSNYPSATGSVDFTVGFGDPVVTVTATVDGNTLNFTVNVAPPAGS